MNLFDLQLGRAAKERGIAAAAESKAENLALARQIAKRLAKSHPFGECDADVVQYQLHQLGISLGNAAGALFKEECWDFTGKFKQSERVVNHARLLRIWRLKETA